MKRKLLLFTSLLLCVSIAFAQDQFAWGLDFGSSKFDETTDIAVDASGNVYVTGIFEDSVDVGDGTTPDYVKSNGFRDIFLGKFNADGEKVWAYGLGDLAWDRGWALAVDPQGAVYAGGVFSRTVDFDPSSGTTELTSNPAGVWPDGYLAKYDTDGNLEWAHHLLTARDRSASQTATLLAITSMEIDMNGDLVIGGAFWDTVYLSQSTMLVSDGPLRDMFLAKYDSDGNLIWGQQMGGSADQQIQDLATDAQGNIFTTGYFFGSPDFDPAGGGTILNTQGAEDIFLAKYLPSGALDWAQGFGSVNGNNVTTESGNGIGTDANGNVYVTGRMLGSIDFDPNGAGGDLNTIQSQDIFTAKFDGQGTLDWVFSLEGDFAHYGTALDVLPGGDFLLAGEYLTTNGLDLDPSPDSSLIYSQGGYDVFVARYGPDMTFREGQGHRGLQTAGLNAVASNGSKTVIGGWFEGFMLFNQQAGDLRSSKGSRDMFVISYGPASMSLDDRLPVGTLEVFPNPSDGAFEIQAEWDRPQQASIYIRNLQGQVLRDHHASQVTSVSLQESTLGFTKGMYLIELVLEEGRAIQKLIVR